MKIKKIKKNSGDTPSCLTCPTNEHVITFWTKANDKNFPSNF